MIARSVVPAEIFSRHQAGPTVSPNSFKRHVLSKKWAERREARPRRLPSMPPKGGRRFQREIVYTGGSSGGGGGGSTTGFTSVSIAAAVASIAAISSSSAGLLVFRSANCCWILSMPD